MIFAGRCPPSTESGGSVQYASYPALFRSADDASNKRQKAYLRLIGGEYAALLLASVLSDSAFKGTTFYLLYAFIFVVSVVLLLVRNLWKLQQDWYRCRALAESVKTLTWRYTMRAAPFADGPSPQDARAEFRNQLFRTFDANRIAADKIDPNWSADDQIADEMDRIRALSLDERKKYYMAHRLNDQRIWYMRKAEENSRSARNWVIAAVVAYILAFALVLARIRFPDWEFWGISPIIVFASSVLGWTQVKKFNELVAAYTVTAHEMGLIKPKLDAVNSESDFSNFINDAELAFSREHTLWIARQSK
jgi:hypothetical protein